MPNHIAPVLERFETVHGQQSLGDIRVMLADQRARLAGRAGADVPALKNDDLAGTTPGQLIRGGQAIDAGADHDDIGGLRKIASCFIHAVSVRRSRHS